MSWKNKELNIVNFVENEPEEFIFNGTQDVISKDGEKYEVMEVVTEMGSTEHYFMSGHLKHLIEKNGVVKGDKIRVTYLGKVEADIVVDGKLKATKVNKYRLEVWEE